MEVERKVNSKIYITRLLLQIELNNQMRNRTNLVLQTVSPGKKKPKKNQAEIWTSCFKNPKKKCIAKNGFSCWFYFHYSSVKQLFAYPVSQNMKAILSCSSPPPPSNFHGSFLFCSPVIQVLPLCSFPAEVTLHFNIMEM